MKTDVRVFVENHHLKYQVQDRVLTELSYERWSCIVNGNEYYFDSRWKAFKWLELGVL